MAVPSRNNICECFLEATDELNIRLPGGTVAEHWVLFYDRCVWSKEENWIGDI
jgi:hypothetical protein